MLAKALCGSIAEKRGDDIVDVVLLESPVRRLQCLTGDHHERETQCAAFVPRERLLPFRRGLEELLAFIGRQRAVGSPKISRILGERYFGGAAVPAMGKIRTGDRSQRHCATCASLGHLLWIVLLGLPVPELSDGTVENAILCKREVHARLVGGTRTAVPITTLRKAASSPRSPLKTEPASLEPMQVTRESTMIARGPLRAVSS